MSLLIAVAAGGAGWEARVLAEIAGSPTWQLKRRCLDLAEVLALSQMCDVAVVSTDLAGLTSDAVVSLERDGVRVVAIGDADRAHRLGISHVAAPGSLYDAMTPVVSAPSPAPSPPAATPVIAVWGPHGAPGRSVIAASLAASFAANGASVHLVDADPRGGSLAQMFALLDDVSGLAAACRSADRGQAADIGQHAVPVGDSLRLMTGVPRADMWSQVPKGPFERVLQHLARQGGHLVIDTGPGLDEHTRSILEAAEAVVVVGRADPVGLARLVRMLLDLGDLRQKSTRRPPVVVVNQWRSGSGWSRHDIESALVRLAGVAPDLVIEADHRTLDRAAIRGVPPVASATDSPFAKGIHQLVETLGRPTRTR